jgi:hypothetical protein
VPPSRITYLSTQAQNTSLPFSPNYRTVWAAGKVLARHHSHLSPALHHALPTLAGLAMIPLVVPHIDHAVTEWMDTTIRPQLNLPFETTVLEEKNGAVASKHQNEVKNRQVPVEYFKIL